MTVQAVPPDPFDRLERKVTSILFVAFGVLALVLGPYAVFTGSISAFFLALFFSAVFALGRKITLLQVSDLFRIKGKRD